jgi:hypothetical protein
MLKLARSLPLIAVSLLTVSGLFLWIGADSLVSTNPFGSKSADEILPAGEVDQVLNPLPTIIPYTPTSSPTISFTATNAVTKTSASTWTPTPGGGEVLTIGYSVEGRPLEVFRFGRGVRSLLIIAGVHGGYEWNTVALADQLIEYLKTNPDIVPEENTLFILRILNPDGYARDLGADGRANANNVDINRNWDANWQPKWSGTQCWSKRVITAGSKPFSEPETQALMRFIQAYQVERIINYHSAGLGIFAGGTNDQNSKALANALAQVSPYSFPPVATDCQFTGQLIDWASAQGIAAVDVELSNHTETDFEFNLEILKTFLAWEPEK